MERAKHHDDEPRQETTVNTDTERINDTFAHHPPASKERINAHESVRATIREAAHRLNEHVPPCEERSIALDKLREAMFWANAGIALSL